MLDRHNATILSEVRLAKKAQGGELMLPKKTNTQLTSLQTPHGNIVHMTYIRTSAQPRHSTLFVSIRDVI